MSDIGEEVDEDQFEDVSMSKGETALQNLIEKQLRMYRRTGKYIEKLKEKFKETYGRDFVEGVGQKIPLTDSLTMSTKKTSHNYANVLPEGVKCCVCRSNSANRFDATTQVCRSCSRLQYKHANHSLTCDGVLQQLDQCIPDHRYFTCVRCTAAKVKELTPKYYPHDNLESSVDKIPPAAKERGVGYLMDLGKDTFYRTVGDNDRVSNFNRSNLPEGATTAAVLVRVMDFNEKSKRVIANMLLRFECDDPRHENSYGLKQMMVTGGMCDRLFYGKDTDSVISSLIYVDMDLIEWSPWGNGWNNMAAIAFICLNLADFLLNPPLNNHPNQDKNEGQTHTANLWMEAEYIKDDKFIPQLEYFMNKRGCPTIEWNKSDSLLKSTFPSNAQTKRGKKPKYQKSEPAPKKSKSSSSSKPSSKDSTEEKPVAVQKKKFVGVIYGKITETGMVYIGDNTRGLSPRSHDTSCPCSFCAYLDNHDEKYFNRVLYYFVNKEEAHNYEGMIQIVFALAAAYGMKLTDLKLPFPLKPENYRETWPDLDPDNLPDIPILLVNTFIHGRSLSFAQYTEFLNMPKVLFNSELNLDYNWEHDYLRYGTQLMEVESDVD